MTVREHTIRCGPEGEHLHTIDLAKEIVPGLLVYRIPDGMHPASPHRWRIGHEKSGFAVADSLRCEAAIAGAELLGTLADWTQDAAALKASIDPTDLFVQLSYVDCIEPASEPFAPGADVSHNGCYGDDDIREAADAAKDAGYNALQITTAMSATVPWSGLDTEQFNAAHARIVTLANAN